MRGAAMADLGRPESVVDQEITVRREHAPLVFPFLLPLRHKLGDGENMNFLTMCSIGPKAVDVRFRDIAQEEEVGVIAPPLGGDEAQYAGVALKSGFFARLATRRVFWFDIARAFATTR